MRRTEDEERIDLGQVFTEIKEGWSFIFLNPVVRSVNIGLATGLVGGGMVVPLGAVFATEVLDAGPAGFGLFITALGVGVAVGVIVISMIATAHTEGAGVRAERAPRRRVPRRGRVDEHVRALGAVLQPHGPLRRRRLRPGLHAPARERRGRAARAACSPVSTPSSGCASSSPSPPGPSWRAPSTRCRSRSSAATSRSAASSSRCPASAWRCGWRGRS